MKALPKTDLTVDQFMEWCENLDTDDRFELVDGQVVGMGLDRASHNRAKLRTANAIGNALATAKIDCEVFLDGMGVSQNKKNYRIPDVVVNCGPVDSGAYLVPNPVIVVEIVSPSSEDRDIHVKLTEYFAIDSVCHYLIIYPERKVVVHHSRASSTDTVRTVFIPSGMITFSPPGFSVSAEILLASNSPSTF